MRLNSKFQGWVLGLVEGARINFKANHLGTNLGICQKADIKAINENNKVILEKKLKPYICHINKHEVY